MLRQWTNTIIGAETSKQSVHSVSFTSYLTEPILSANQLNALIKQPRPATEDVRSTAV